MKATALRAAPTAVAWRMAAQIEQLEQALLAERERAKQLISAHIGKMQRLINAFPVAGDVAKLHKEATLDVLEKDFWLSDESLDFIAPKARAFYQKLVRTCQLTDVEIITLKLVAMDFSDNQIRVLMGSTRMEYARVVLSRIKQKCGIDYSIRKTFRKLNATTAAD